MKKISSEKLKDCIKKHGRWLDSDGQQGAKADLNETDLSEMDLSGVNLSEANLLMADLSKANLSGANLVMVDLSQADLSGADLSGTDLSGADLVLTDLSKADLSGVDLSVSDLSGANLSQARLPGAKLTQANLSRANFSKTDLLGADLSGADLSGALLNASNLSGTNLSNTNLANTHFNKANLLLVSLTGAQFHQTNLSDIIVDGFTLSEIPASERKEQGKSFRVIESDKMGAPKISREMYLPEPFHRAGLSLTVFLCSLVARRYGKMDVRLDFKGPVIRLTIHPPDAITRSEIEALLEVYGRIIQDKLNVNVLSNSLVDVHRFKGQLVFARTLLEDDRRLLQEEGGKPVPAASDMNWLKSYVGKRLEFADLPADHLYGPPADDEKNGRGNPMEIFQQNIRMLTSHAPSLTIPLSTIKKTFQLKHPNDEIIGELENALKTIWANSHEMFDEISDAFYDSGLNENNSEWADIWYEMIQKLA